MAFASTGDGVRLFYESAGQGRPLVFVHEFGGNYWSWEPQVSYFSGRPQCITFAARGYLPSDIPERVEQYPQARAADDIVAVMNAAGIGKAHVVGLSMGAFACAHAALRHPDRVLSAVVAGAGYGSEKEHQEAFRQNSEQVARGFEERGAEGFTPFTPRARRAFSSRTRIHAAGRCLPKGSRNTPPAGPPTLCGASKCAALRSTM
ncbi:alpha/beta fold hydrolase [Microvirga aerilata]|uniref:alpha/beta fold hydrolase n=1 Tax=Microvirga aerilata TaxID=670292 RepID=UPI003641F411